MIEDMTIHPCPRAGSAMLIVLTVLATLSSLVIASLAYTSAVSRATLRSHTMRKATGVGDGVLELAFAHWREICRQQTNTQRSTADFAAMPLPTQALFPAVANFTASTGENSASATPFTVANFRIEAVDPQLNELATNETTPIPAYGMTLGTASFYYLATADVTLPNLSGKPVAVKLRRVFEKQIESPWNYALFFADRLEIQPGALFTITGAVHTNSSLYTAHDSLTFGGKVTYTDDWSIGFAPGDKSHTGTTPEAPHQPANLPPARDQAKQPFGLDATRIFDTADSNPNNDSYRELVERPVAGKTDPIAAARYYNQASVRVLVDSSNNITIKNGSDATVTSASTGEDLALHNVFMAALKTNDRIQDNRENAEMRLVTVDMSAIQKALTIPAQGGTGELINTSFNGVIYVSDTSGSATVKRGVRLKNGAKMPAGGLTLASDNAIYIQGDYNTGRTINSSGTVTHETPTNTNNDGTGSNTAFNYTRQPCAVVADAVTILSNAWIDADSDKDVASRDASPTTVNTAIVAGIVPSGLASSGANSYSGGAENFPRLMEDWGSNKTFTYYGSMVQLFQSRQNIGKWGNSNVYGAPRRVWFFDTLFYTTPPPGTLTLVSYNKQRWFQQ
jgi:hypothetical protein